MTLRVTSSASVWPPKNPQRSERRSYFDRSAPIIITICVGTPCSTVMRSLPTSDSVSCTSKPRVSTLVAPRCTNGMNCRCSCAMWNSGLLLRMVSSARKPHSTCIAWLPMISARCERTTPFGRPVVPEVYMMKAGSCQPTSASGSASEPGAMNFSNGISLPSGFAPT